MTPTRKGILLVNLGSPDSPAVGDVRKFLREFLMDARVLDAPWPIRFGVVHFLILPFRPRASAEAYAKIWTPEGSPLKVISQKVTEALRARVDLPVHLAMRYQSPSIDAGLEALLREGADEILLIPLFPHYAMSSYETAVEKVREVLNRKAPGVALAVQPPYFDRPDYIRALAESARAGLDEGFDHLMISFHGIPERHLKKSDPTCGHCLQAPDCCAGDHPAHRTCYRAQCQKTAEAFVREANVPKDKYSVTFQSRLGRDPWLKPYTDLEIERLGREGVQRLKVICPAFVSDCLETVEEIDIRGRDSFKESGGGDCRLIPCLNDHPSWVQTLMNMVSEFELNEIPKK
jgi:ferrochelatase